MRSNRLATVIAALAAVAAVVTVIVWGTSSSSAPTARGERDGRFVVGDLDGPPRADVLVRSDSHVLSQAVTPGRVTLVAFLDFECEACSAVYPATERLRADYQGRITYVVRFFPMSSHRNAELAARSAQAAANQGGFEPMYRMLFDHQSEWAERQESQRDLFVRYAAVVGLDLGPFTADLDAPATAARAAADQADGLTAGVEGAPTFFLDGRRLLPQSEVDLRATLDAAVTG